MERKNRNPNSHKLRKQTDPSKSWSELPADLLNSICERLGFADFQRAKSVCSSWYSPLRHSMSKRQIPWLILLPNQYNKHYWCTLFNPEEDKLYKTQDLGVHFAMCVCIANYGSWLLMRYPLYSLYIVNPFTKERIDLPPVELQVGTIKIQGTFDDKFLMSDDHDQWECDDITIRSPVFWIDERTKDYVVLWGLGVWCVVYAKRGDNSWKQIPGTSDCFDMVYKDHKLYFSSSTRSMLKIFDFSGENPQEIFQCGVTVNKFDAELYHDIGEWWVLETKLVVTVTGNVLKVEKMLKRDFDWVPTWSFRVYKVYSRGVYTKDEPVSSLGDEAMLFDLGITMLANDIEGFKKNSIYSIMCSPETNTTDNKTAIRVFNLETQKMEPLLEFDCLSPQQLARALWIIPNFNPKCF